MYVFGGGDPHGPSGGAIVYNKVYSLHLSTLFWRELQTTGAPPPSTQERLFISGQMNRAFLWSMFLCQLIKKHPPCWFFMISEVTGMERINES